MPPYLCNCGLRCWDPRTPPAYCTQRPLCGPFVDEGIFPEDVTPDTPPPPDLPPPPGGSVAVQNAVPAIALVPLPHPPMPVGLLSLPVEMFHLILTHVGPGLVPVLGALRQTSPQMRRLTQLALGADISLSAVPIFANMFSEIQVQWQPQAANIDRELAVSLTGNLETLKDLVKRLTALRKQCQLLLTQLDGLLGGIDNVCRHVAEADPARRATITDNLLALRDLIRALRGAIAAKAEALRVRLAAATKARDSKAAIKRL